MSHQTTFSSLRSDLSLQAIFKTHDLDPKLQGHVARVFGLVGATVVAAALGSLANVYLEISSSLCSIMSIIAIMWLGSMAPPAIENESADIKRQSFLLAVGALTGASLTPFIIALIDINPSIVPSAFLGAAVVFLCFAGAAMYSKRRSALYLGGVLGSALSTLCILNLANFFLHSQIIFSLQLYGGLLLFSMFVAFDTQLMIERADSGYGDAVRAALELFLDFINIFVRIASILGKSEGKKKNSRTSSR